MGNIFFFVTDQCYRTSLAGIATLGDTRLIFELKNSKRWEIND